jgi:hypothetical protein
MADKEVRIAQDACGENRKKRMGAKKRTEREGRDTEWTAGMTRETYRLVRPGGGAQKVPSDKVWASRAVAEQASEEAAEAGEAPEAERFGEDRKDEQK